MSKTTLNVLEEYNRKIGCRVKELRKSKQIKQQDLAEMMGYSKNHMCALENGRKNFTTECLISIAKHLECTFELLMSGVPASYVSRVEGDAYKILMDDVNLDSYEIIKNVIDMAWCKDHPDEDIEARLEEIKQKL